MINNWIILFCVIPLAAGVLSAPLVMHRTVCRVIGVASFVAMLALGIGLLVSFTDDRNIYVSQMGAWLAPYGISIVFDSISGLLVTTAALVALACYVHAFASLDPKVEARYFHPLIQLLMFGVNLSFLTGDLFNLFVAFEIMLMASYGLLSIGASRRQVSQAYKYVVLNLLASTVFVIAAGMTYGMFGTLNMADLMRIVAEIEADPARDLPIGFTALAVMLLLVFGMKGAFFPLWAWLPDTYYTCPIAIGALFGGVLTKVGVYTVIRLFPLVFTAGPADSVIIPIIATSAGMTMLLGVLGAVSHHEVRRVLAVLVIAGVGFMIFAIALMSETALAGCVFYMVQSMVVTAALFLICGIVERHTGTDDLQKLGGLFLRDGWLSLLFFIAAMSLVGLPPMSGFFGKMVIVREGFRFRGNGGLPLWWLSVAALIAGTLMLLAMLRVWGYGFWSPMPKSYSVKTTTADVRRTWRCAYIAVYVLVVVSVGIGLAAQPIYNFAARAGYQLTHREDYVRAVLHPQGVEQQDDRLVAAEVRR